jgi:peroxiredoxin
MKARWLPAILLICLASISAQSPAVPTPAGFGEPPLRTLDVSGFSDEAIGTLLQTLDALLVPSRPSRAPGASESPGLVFGNFTRRLQQGRLSAAQEARVLGHLGRIGRVYPQHADLAERSAFVVRSLMVGKVAPEITGTDLDGAPLKLSDQRGKVVVLTFAAEWCAICRTQYPYERLMLELYERWPFTLLAVETGSSRERVRAARVAQNLRYRAWWDEPDDDGQGPIAAAWRVSGFPSGYVIDGKGVIRFVDLRHEDLLKAVRQVLTEEADSAIARSTTAQ